VVGQPNLGYCFGTRDMAIFPTVSCLDSLMTRLRGPDQAGAACVIRTLRCSPDDLLCDTLTHIPVENEVRIQHFVLTA
jgi:hypothetical protein